MNGIKVSFFSDVTSFEHGDFIISPPENGYRTQVRIMRVSTGEAMDTSKEQLFTAIHEAIEKYFDENKRTNG